jgi:hypothetical protein
MSSIVDLADSIWQSFIAIKDAALGIVKAILSFLNLPVPEFIIELASIIVMVLLLLKYGKFIGKILIIVLLLFLANILVTTFFL